MTYKNSREGTAANTYGTRKCLWDGCGQEFVAKASNAKYCRDLDCVRKRNQAKNRPKAVVDYAAAEARAAVDAEAFRLHGSGYNYVEIGKMLGMTKGQAGYAVRRGREAS
jgi:hypothetical protein